MSHWSFPRDGRSVLVTKITSQAVQTCGMFPPARCDPRSKYFNTYPRTRYRSFNVSTFNIHAPWLFFSTTCSQMLPSSIFAACKSRAEVSKYPANQLMSWPCEGSILAETNSRKASEPTWPRRHCPSPPLARWLKRRRTRSQPTRRTLARNQTPEKMPKIQRYAPASVGVDIGR
jgi:hypothetical protein